MRHGTVYYTRQERADKAIIHKIATVPVIPHGWMIYVDDKPAYGMRVMRYQEVLTHLKTIKTMIEHMNKRVPGSGVWLLDSEQEVAPIVPPQDAILLTKGEEEVNDHSLLPIHYQQQGINSNKTEDIQVKERPLNKEEPENKEEK